MQRVIGFEGCLNFRDLGGYPTEDGRTLRWRQLFRSDALHRLSEADIARFRDELLISDVVDLRSSAEVRTDGRGLLAGEAIRFHHLPLFDGDASAREEHPAAYTLADRYFLLAEFAKEAIGRVITALAETRGPAVYHCAAGKDRTGVVSAVLLGLLGVRDEIIVADYAATQQNLDAIIERLMASEGYQTMLGALPPDTLHAQPETMIALLERVRSRYGSMRDYARAAGVSEGSIARLDARLLTGRD
jgi:protein-tyrosine phosphatase